METQLKIFRLLHSSKWIVTMYVFLGIFAGYDFAMLYALRGISYHRWRVILVSVMIGLCFGVATSFCKQRCENIYPTKWCNRIVWLVYAVALWVTGITALQANKTILKGWTPVSIPIRFDIVNRVSVTFISDVDDIDDINIDMKRNLPFEDINGFMGGWIDTDQPSVKAIPRPSIIWSVSGVEGALYEYWRPWYWGETVGLNIGRFHVVAGRTYTITAEVTKPSPKAQVLDPYLQVSATHQYSPGWKVWNALIQMSNCVALAIGTMLASVIFMKIIIEYWRR